MLGLLFGGPVNIALGSVPPGAWLALAQKSAPKKAKISSLKKKEKPATGAKKVKPAVSHKATKTVKPKVALSKAPAEKSTKTKPPLKLSKTVPVQKVAKKTTVQKNGAAHTASPVKADKTPLKPSAKAAALSKKTIPTSVDHATKSTNAAPKTVSKPVQKPVTAIHSKAATLPIPQKNATPLPLASSAAAVQNSASSSVQSAPTLAPLTTPAAIGPVVAPPVISTPIVIPVPAQSTPTTVQIGPVPELPAVQSTKAFIKPTKGKALAPAKPLLPHIEPTAPILAVPSVSVPATPKPAIVPAAQTQPVRAVAPKVSPNVKKVTPADTGDETLNAILGIPTPSKPVKPGISKSGAQPKPSSFLGPLKSTDPATTVDYGLFSLTRRQLEALREKVQNALEATRQLGISVSVDGIQLRIDQSTQNQKTFESLYLGGKTQQGLDAAMDAKKELTEAMAMVAPVPRVEARAIWLDRSTILAAQNADGLRKLLGRLHTAGINVVYFESLNAGFPIYPSHIIQNNPMVQGWDPLDVAVREGHRLGMEVHAWVWCFAVGNKRHNLLINKPESYAGPILEEGGYSSEALRNHEGGLQVDGRQNEYWLSPASQKARDLLLSIYKEIVTRYDVDGIQLDYIRYPFQTAGTRMGYEPIGKERFFQATGKSLDNNDDTTLRLWLAWKTYQVNTFVQQISQTLRVVNPAIKISAAVFPMQRNARIVAIQQDWETWVNNGWVDTLSPMTYTTDPTRLQSMFEYTRHSPKKLPLIYAGIDINHLNSPQLAQEIDALRAKGGLGETLFAGAYLTDEKSQLLGQGTYRNLDALIPHRDLLLSIKTLTSDFREKFERIASLASVSQVDSITPAPGETLTPLQASTIRAALNQFISQLDSMGISKTPPSRLLSPLGSLLPLPLNSHSGTQKIPVTSIRSALDQYRVFKQSVTPWLAIDKKTHAYRADYLSRSLQLLDTLMLYFLDHNSIVTPSDTVSTSLESVLADMIQLYPLPSDTPPLDPNAPLEGTTATGPITNPNANPAGLSLMMAKPPAQMGTNATPSYDRNTNQTMQGLQKSIDNGLPAPATATPLLYMRRPTPHVKNPGIF